MGIGEVETESDRLIVRQTNWLNCILANAEREW